MVLAVDVGATKMLGGLITDGGDPVKTRQTKAPGEKYMADLTSLVDLLMKDATDATTPVQGIGIGAAGVIDHETGKLRRSLSFRQQEIPIRDVLSAEFGVPVFVDNDIHAATLGELRFGAGRTHNNFIMVNAGTGVSVGLIFNHRLHRGVSNSAGEFGHTSIDLDGPACICGLPGCLETLIAKARGRTTTSAPIHFSRVSDPPPSPEYAYLALGLVNLVNLLNPEAIVLMGGMITNNPGAVEWLLSVVKAQAIDHAVAGLSHFGVSAAGKMAGLLGAAALVLEDASSSVGSTTNA